MSQRLILFNISSQERMDIKTMSNYQNPSVQLREAYNRTLKEAEFSGSASFYCGPGDNGSSYVLCRECPLNKTDCEEKHDAKYWRQWGKVLTGEGENNKKIACEKVGILCEDIHIDEEKDYTITEMKEVTEILRLLAKAIEQNTINTYQEQGSTAADVVFHILEDAEKRIDVLDHKTEKDGEQE